MPKVRLEPQGICLEAPKKANLLMFLQENEVPVGNACGGNGLCASCKLNILEGYENLSRPNDIEVDLAERNSLATHERISCQTKIMGDITVTASYWGPEDVKTEP